MFTIKLRFIAQRVKTCHRELLKDGEKAFNCPKCGKSMTYFRMPPRVCENYSCKFKLPNVDMLWDEEARLLYHYNLDNITKLEKATSFKELQELMWTQVPSMYSRL